MIPKNIQFSDDNQELLKSILPGLPISVFLTSFRQDTYNYVNWHWHAAFQYCLVTEGSVDFLLPNHSYCVTAGSGIFINTQQVHLIREAASSPSSYLCIDIPPAFICPDEHSRIYLKYLKPVLQNPLPQVLILSKHTTEDCQILQSLKNIQQLLKNDTDFMELDIQSEIIKIWKTTFHKLERADQGPSPLEYNDNNRLKIILQYMQNHYAEKISLEDVAQQLSLSKSECCRFFKKVTGQPMFSYLNIMRINKSMDLLRDTDMSIAEIADVVGFCNQSYYSDCFRKIKGITPKKFRVLSLRRPSDILPLDISSQQT